jgi:hypothetical protein
VLSEPATRSNSEKGWGDGLGRTVAVLEERQRITREANDVGDDVVEVVLGGDGDVAGEVVGEGAVEEVGWGGGGEVAADARL